jgi:hypothetical protein
MRKLIFTLVLMVSIAALAPVSSAGAAGLPKKKYNCYVFFAPGVPTFTDRYVKIKSSKKYAWFNSKTTKSGKYKLSGDKIKFKSGPLKGKKGKRHVYGNGTTGITIRMGKSANSNYSCS